MFEPTEYTEKHLFAGNNQPRNFGAGTVYGSDLKAGSVVATYGVATADAKAKKSITYTGASPVATKKVAVTIGDKTFEYTIANSDTVTDIAAGLKALINNASTGSALVTASNTSGKLELEAKEYGVDGNSIAISSVAEAGSDVTVGDLTVETKGQVIGDELIEIVDSDNATAALQDPIGVLVEDTPAGKTGTIAYTGEFNVDELKFASGDTINTFKKALRKIGIFARPVND